ncbi:hypothetical protein E1211_15280 [Micromonospora sp. 15K316]|uniref:hypothetical protein n=1 Tax=Micromonospora sp. 15K316 TaxID=2530376 RepID=UPI00104565B5|nr:hypothetical protein [Micromonospora sp. 15K316]TDC35666.1 hypothetical protein E1211_15280 [Micromonospora sp. 15K316]
MTHQAPLIHDGRGGIWPRYRLPGTHSINAAPWMDAIARRQPVGTCRSCAGYLFPNGPPYGGARRWYPTRCVTCKSETAAPGPAPARKKRKT